MPYFSFSLKKNFFTNNNVSIEDVDLIIKNKTYFSKNTYLWKNLNKNKNNSYINFVKYEERIKITLIGKKILFCLPPAIGLGDAIEYALAIKSLTKSNKFELVAVAFVGRFHYIFTKYFNLNNIFKSFVKGSDFVNFDTIFHLTLEIKALVNQKYLRTDIEKAVNTFFDVKEYRKKNILKKNKIKKITIFPISKSPLRSMPLKILIQIIQELANDFKIEVILDNDSLISNYIKESINNYEIEKFIPDNLESLCEKIESIEYGIFMDSGPLHLAKILNKKGIVILTTVGNEILLNNFTSINVFKNNFKSKYCSSPCGLTNIFNYKNKSGCYDSLKISFDDLIKLDNNNSLQRGELKNNYLFFSKNPVSCLLNINVDKLIKEIRKGLEFK